ncbi:hypothetical protein AALP_AA3G112000 [Arabis alpina]|uniref:FBD domain-containing protein n=1 Tax=Arabis alpina TaxID=50452 RepID=A0A087H8H6_ARAAL|nr:hypothetical protein AALP_AA3G112000 [Arabis alpina]
MPPCLDMAKVVSASHPNDNFLRSLSSVMYLNLNITNKADAICSAVNFSRLIECKLTPHYPSVNWVKSVMRLLRNSPKLRALMIISNYFRQYEDLPLGSSVPECLSCSLKIVEWEDYRGTREEKKVMTYILENSKCLKTIRISLKCDNEEKKKTVMEELESMYRVSESSQLFFSTQFRWSSMMKQHPAYQIMSSI